MNNLHNHIDIFKESLIQNVYACWTRLYCICDCKCLDILFE